MSRKQVKPKRPQVPNEELITDLQRVAKENDGQYITMLHYSRHGKFNEKTIRARFGTWTNALKEAGLPTFKDDLSGKNVGFLTVIERTDEKRFGYWVWKCKCDCGNFSYVPSQPLRSKSTTSCGCKMRLGNSLKYPEEYDFAVRKGVEKLTHETGIRYIDFNKQERKDNSSGYRGVSPYQTKKGTKYVAELAVKKARHRKWGFDTAKEAYQYRLELEEKYLPEDFRKKLEELRNEK